jgi:hypothetical protein
MPKFEKKKIMLGDAVDDIINFRDPRMTDGDFVRRLVDEIVNDDLAVRLGSTPEWETNVRRHAEDNVRDVVKAHGLSDRNRVITEAYNNASNSQPREPMFPYRNSAFLNGSDYDRKHRRP